MFLKNKNRGKVFQLSSLYEKMNTICGLQWYAFWYPNSYWNLREPYHSQTLFVWLRYLITYMIALADVELYEDFQLFFSLSLSEWCNISHFHTLPGSLVLNLYASHAEVPLFYKISREQIAKCFCCLPTSSLLGSSNTSQCGIKCLS